MRARWIVVGVGVSVAALSQLPAATGLLRGQRAADPPPAQVAAPTIAKVSRTVRPAPSKPAPAPLDGLDLTRIRIKGDGVTAPLAGDRVARLTIDPKLQRATRAIMRMHQIPEASVVLMDVETGEVLVYATHIEKGKTRDMCVEAKAPAASVFKIVTSTSLLENAGVTPGQRECYSGGERGITKRNLERDPKRDRWCTTVASALGRSINTVFARLAHERLSPRVLGGTARSLGFGAPLPFDVAVEPSAAHFPEDPLGFARTAAGFWNTTLSPLHAAWISATVARGGEPVRPVIVRDVVDDAGKVVWTGKSGVTQERVMKAETARSLTTMMDKTVAGGTSYRAFHDRKRRAFLPGIAVAGKTGTLTDHKARRFYTWFTGFAPSHPYKGRSGDDADHASARKLAIGVLVVNGPKWRIKANTLAREVLRVAYDDLPGVSSPGLRARRHRHRSTTPGTKHRRHRGS